MSTVPKKSLFHSELASRSPIQVTVKGQVKASKYPGKPPYCYLSLKGDFDEEGKPMERSYSVDSADVEAFLNQYAGQTFTVAAEGSRETARLIYCGEPGSQIQQPAARQNHPTPHNTAAPKAVTPPPAQAPAARTNGSRPAIPSSKALTDAKVFTARRVSLKKICIKAMMVLKAEAEAAGAPPMPPESFWAQVTTLNISVESEGLGIRAGFADALPVNIELKTLTEVAKTGTRQPAPTPPPPTSPTHPEPAEPEDDDVPF